jgi:diguanylate cyclase (GGDEF)-like protein/PAS domain S-box-containing protein
MQDMRTSESIAREDQTQRRARHDSPAGTPQNRPHSGHVGPCSRNPRLRIVFAHSNLAEVGLCVNELSRARFNFTVDLAMSADQLAKLLKSSPCDVVVAEFRGHGSESIRPMEVIIQSQSHAPLIFVTNSTQPGIASDLLSHGATDCIEMSRIGHLPVAIRRALSEKKLRDERDRAERQLRFSEAHYRALVGNLAYGICQCNTEGKFLDVNQALVMMLGFSSRQQLLRVNLASEIICDPRRRSQLLGVNGENNPLNPMETEWKRMDGTTLKIRVSGREVEDEMGVLAGYEIIVEDVTKQREVENQLRRLAIEDPLTGIANYRHLVEVLDSEIKRSNRTGREFALLLFDLDGLKQINDRYGHMVGSEAICRLADILCLSCRDLDTPARFGGDEFALVLPEAGRESADLVARRVRDSLASDGREPKLSVSVGISIYPTDSGEIESLLSAADASMYRMKAEAQCLQ